MVVKEPSWLCLLCDEPSVPRVSVVPAVVGCQSPGHAMGTGRWARKGGIAVSQSSNPSQPLCPSSLVAPLSLREEELGEDMPGLIWEADHPSAGHFAIPGQGLCRVMPGPGRAGP